MSSDKQTKISIKDRINKVGCLLVNTGTPDSCAPQDVSRYLTQFLLDPRVIDLPYLVRQFLVRAIIIPFRYRKSAKNYAAIWTKEGSPLLSHSLALVQSLQELLPNLSFALGMRYGKPSIEDALNQLKRKGIQTLVIVPLFPQYASATTGSVMEETLKQVAGWQLVPSIVSLSEFATHPLFLDAWAKVATPFQFSTYDHILFSFHGIPLRHIKKTQGSPRCFASGCCTPFSAVNFCCYRAQCLATAAGIASRLGISEEHYSVSFQSRLGKDLWLTPYTSDLIKKRASMGNTKLCVFAPSFVADCLETLYEIAMEYREEFFQMGGKVFDLVPSLNTHPSWVFALSQIIQENIISDVRVSLFQTESPSKKDLPNSVSSLQT